LLALYMLLGLICKSEEEEEEEESRAVIFVGRHRLALVGGSLIFSPCKFRVRKVDRIVHHVPSVSAAPAEGLEVQFVDATCLPLRLLQYHECWSGRAGLFHTHTADRMVHSSRHAMTKAPMMYNSSFPLFFFFFFSSWRFQHFNRLESRRKDSTRFLSTARHCRW
jgi:hypothetical protein